MTDVRAESGTRARTRRAILDAAVDVLTADPAASLGDIATAAGVGRTTVHRYFPERADLLTALSKSAWDQVAEATERARPHEGPAADALDRLCQEYFDLGRVLTLVFNDPQQYAAADWDTCSPADKSLLDLVERGHEDGTIDPRLSPLWVQNMLWSMLYSAWQYAQEHQVSRHQALDMCLYSLRKTLRP
ncbi:TetR/AcrR family transcriptional regulator [Actinokineospora sp. NPDC004072]